MLTVHLLTSELEHVADVELTPFVDHMMPEMVMWAERCFMRHGKFRHGQWYYVEGFWVVSRTPLPGLPRVETPYEPPQLRRELRKAPAE